MFLFIYLRDGLLRVLKLNYILHNTQAWTLEKPKQLKAAGSQFQTAK